MKAPSRRLAVLAGLTLTAACLSVPPAATAIPSEGETRPATAQKLHVRGEQIPVDAAKGRYVMRGDLIGDWLYVPRTPPLHTSDTLYVEAGTEVFNGCIDRNANGKCGRRDHRGELHLAFIYWASYDLDGNLIKGQCVHPITGGTGAFTGARGVLRMVDRPLGDDVKTTYRGHIILNAVPTESATGSGSITANSSGDERTATTPARRGC